MNNATLVGYETPLTFNQFYSAETLNELFEQIATLLNNKVDVRAPVLSDGMLGNQRIINLADGVEDGDAITVGQLKAMAIDTTQAIPTLNPPYKDDGIARYAELYTDYVPVIMTADNLLPALNVNMRMVTDALSFKLLAGNTAPMTADLLAGGTSLSEVAKGIKDTDAATYENLEDIYNGTL